MLKKVIAKHNRVLWQQKENIGVEGGSHSVPMLKGAANTLNRYTYHQEIDMRDSETFTQRDAGLICLLKYLPELMSSESPLIQIGPGVHRTHHEFNYGYMSNIEACFNCYDHVFRGVNYDIPRGVGTVKMKPGQSIDAQVIKGWIPHMIESCQLEKVSKKDDKPDTKKIAVFMKSNGEIGHVSIEDDIYPEYHRHKMAEHGMFLCDPEAMRGNYYPTIEYYAITGDIYAEASLF